MAEPALFDVQFELVRRLLALKLDLYFYATFTTPTADGIKDKMARFVDRLQRLHSNLPLRLVPLKVDVYSPVAPRFNPAGLGATKYQEAAVEAWQDELQKRFSTTERQLNITDVTLW